MSAAPRHRELADRRPGAEAHAGDTGAVGAVSRLAALRAILDDAGVPARTADGVHGVASRRHPVPTGWSAVDAHFAACVTDGGRDDRSLRGDERRDECGPGGAGRMSDAGHEAGTSHRGGLPRGVVHEWFGVQSPPCTAASGASLDDAALDDAKLDEAKADRRARPVGAVGAFSGARGPHRSDAGALPWSPPTTLLVHLARRALLASRRGGRSDGGWVLWIGEAVHPAGEHLAGRRLGRPPFVPPSSRPEEHAAMIGWPGAFDASATAVARRATARDEGATGRRGEATPVDDPLAEADAGAGDLLLRRSILVDPPNDAARLWAIELAARSPAVAAVVADGRRLRMTHSRRLQLAAAAGSALVLLARPPEERAMPSAATARWSVERARPDDVAGGAGGAPAWTLRLERWKGGGGRALAGASIERSPERRRTSGHGRGRASARTEERPAGRGREPTIGRGRDPAPGVGRRPAESAPGATPEREAMPGPASDAVPRTVPRAARKTVSETAPEATPGVTPRMAPEGACGHEGVARTRGRTSSERVDAAWRIGASTASPPGVAMTDARTHTHPRTSCAEPRPATHDDVRDRGRAEAHAERRDDAEPRDPVGHATHADSLPSWVLEWDRASNRVVAPARLVARPHSAPHAPDAGSGAHAATRGRVGRSEPDRGAAAG